MICIALTKKEAGEALFLLNRALNTLNPEKWPSWVHHVLEKLTTFVEKP